MGGRRLGQNFLLDPSILNRIVDAGELDGDDLVVEIGPGLGAMTRIIAQRAERVIAIELDRSLARRLTRELSPRGNVEVVTMDCMKYDFSSLSPFKVVANIPYYITTPIIFRLLDTAPALSTMVLTVQEEVARRMVAVPGTKDYGVLTIMLGTLTATEIRFPIPRGAFRPPPKVDSAVVRITPRDPAGRPVAPGEIAGFRKLVRAAFSQRRKTVRNALASVAPPEPLSTCFAEVGIDPRQRPDTLGLDRYLELFRSLRTRGLLGDS